MRSSQPYPSRRGNTRSTRTTSPSCRLTARHDPMRSRTSGRRESGSRRLTSRPRVLRRSPRGPPAAPCDLRAHPGTRRPGRLRARGGPAERHRTRHHDARRRLRPRGGPRGDPRLLRPPAARGRRRPGPGSWATGPLPVTRGVPAVRPLAVTRPPRRRCTHLYIPLRPGPHRRTSK
jgi:hypothetical protein